MLHICVTWRRELNEENSKKNAHMDGFSSHFPQRKHETRHTHMHTHTHTHSHTNPLQLYGSALEINSKLGVVKAERETIEDGC